MCVFETYFVLDKIKGKGDEVMKFSNPKFIVIDLTNDDALVAAARCTGAWTPEDISGCVS